MATMGVVGNVLVIFIISVRPQLCTVVNNHIRNLAVADLALLLTTFPLAVLREQDPFHWHLGEAVCKYFFPLTDIFFGVAVWSITAIAIDRYRAIVWGCSGKRACHATIRSAKWTIAAMWIVSFLVVCLPLFFVVEYVEMYGYSDCAARWPDRESGNLMQQCYVITTVVFWYVIPVTICVFAYVEISRKIRQSSNFHKYIREERNISPPPHSNTSSSKKILKAQALTRREKHNAKAMKLLAPVVLVFAITALPGNVFRLMVLYYPPLHTYKYVWLLYNVMVIFLLANSSLNPVIYSIVSEEFRQAFRRSLTHTRSRLRTFSGTFSGLHRHKSKPTIEEVMQH